MQTLTESLIREVFLFKRCEDEIKNFKSILVV